MEIILIFVLILYFLIPINEAFKEHDYGVCKYTNKDGNSWLFCCIGYIQNKDRCEDCPFGTYGEQCKLKCKPNHYGLRCKAECNCKANETCDSKIGCIESTPSGLKDSKETAGKYWFIIGLPCGIIVIAGAVIATILTRILKTRRIINAQIPLNDMQNTSDAADTGNIYDEVDETMMDNLHLPQPENYRQNVQCLESTDSNSSGSTDTCVCGASDGYLNPYTPLAEDWQKHTHVYNDGDDLNEDMESRGYLNPYQPLINEWQKHTHVYDHVNNVAIEKD